MEAKTKHNMGETESFLNFTVICRKKIHTTFFTLVQSASRWPVWCFFAAADVKKLVVFTRLYSHHPEGNCQLLIVNHLIYRTKEKIWKVTRSAFDNTDLGLRKLNKILKNAFTTAFESNTRLPEHL